ncbi:uridine kinase [Agromyces cerinus]|uniref:AAA family ATPase n=1 Tax=Agromyces cerinus TaxID=33878 RepID=UPI001EF8994F|nr:AAA family ATPase [Agromyces cerinus]MBM7830300.1 uridine kinase [Agromyces cerinus]
MSASASGGVAAGTPAASAVRLVLEHCRAAGAQVVAVDGPSGSGKSTLADALVRAWPGRAPELVRLDDVYPGWTGLERAGAEVVRELVARRARGAVGTWRTWDWAAGRVGSVEHSRPGRPLIIEGCGAFAATSSIEAVAIWVEASPQVRKRRALARDAGAFDPYWDLWERQWRRYVARTAPARRADVRVRVTGA